MYSADSPAPVRIRVKGLISTSAFPILAGFTDSTAPVWVRSSGLIPTSTVPIKAGLTYSTVTVRVRSSGLIPTSTIAISAGLADSPAPVRVWVVRLIPAHDTSAITAGATDSPAPVRVRTSSGLIPAHDAVAVTAGLAYSLAVSILGASCFVLTGCCGAGVGWMPSWPVVSFPHVPGIGTFQSPIGPLRGIHVLFGHPRGLGPQDGS